jgi:hypothetical protein
LQLALANCNIPLSYPIYFNSPAKRPDNSNAGSITAAFAGSRVSIEQRERRLPFMLTWTEALRAKEAESGIERRRGLRIQQNRPIKVFEATASRYYGGQTQDVSSTGLRLELPRSMPLRPGKLLSIHVGLSTAGSALANRRNMIPARVVWMSRPQDSDGTTMSVGVEFLTNISAQLDAA